MKTKFYIAYGSNLNKEQMAHRCPNAQFYGTAVLKNYKLSFPLGVLDCTPCEGVNTPVGIWKITKADEAALDVYEGYPRLYVKTNVTVPCRETGEAVQGMMYVMRQSHPIRMPSIGYYDTCLRGYRDCNLIDFTSFKNALEEARKEG